MEAFIHWRRTETDPSYFHLQEAETAFVPSVQDFDKKLAEADAYLQILIDQLKVRLFFYIVRPKSALHFELTSFFT